MSTAILLVEDDLYLRDGLSEVFLHEGYEVDTAADCREARAFLGKKTYSLAVLDVMLPDGSGLELCAEMRRDGKKLPILFLTACDDELQTVRGLDAGADDYVAKPFKLQVLLSRIRALLRRSRETVYECGGLSIDTESMTVHCDGKNIYITPTEYQIISALIKNNGIIVTRRALLESIWDADGNFIDDNTLSVHVSRLRDKIGANRIRTVRGVGYRWEES